MLKIKRKLKQELNFKLLYFQRGFLKIQPKS